MFDKVKGNELKNHIKTITSLKKAQEQSVKTSCDEYTCGLYNGIELSLSVLEQRQPDFIAVVSKEAEVINSETNAGKTIASGVRRISNGQNA